MRVFIARTRFSKLHVRLLLGQARHGSVYIFFSYGDWTLLQRPGGSPRFLVLLWIPVHGSCCSWTFSSYSWSCIHLVPLGLNVPWWSSSTCISFVSFSSYATWWSCIPFVWFVPMSPHGSVGLVGFISLELLAILYTLCNSYRSLWSC